MRQPQTPTSAFEAEMTQADWDAGKRASDHMHLQLTLHGFDAIKDGCMAIRLSDGGSDGIIYENKTDAIKHQLHEQQCYYVYFRGLGPAGPNPREMAIMLVFQRKAYAAGFRMVDPDLPNGGPELLMTAPRFDFLRGRRSRG